MFVRFVMCVAVILLAACANPATPTRAPIAAPTNPIALQPTSAPIATNTPPARVACAPTNPDQLGPFFTPGAPQRSQVGTGYVLSGVVRAANTCAPIANAKIEVWMANAQGVYDDARRATLFSGNAGVYRFESHFPPPYSGRPPHIHLRVTVAGFAELVTQHYPVVGQSQATFDLVLSSAR
ncbi:MAG: intradiol ring-cleavage dioxygenase [Chloroflexi bacterium]|nr:intradiol ring-cleavage dioxygenase [Chloroflexota bacterium]